MRTLIKNCNIASPGKEIIGGALLIEDDKIYNVLTPGESRPKADITIDAEGLTAIPGLVDVHFHGRNGYDFCDASVEGVNTIAYKKLAEGVTTILPTTLTVGLEQLKDTLNSITKYDGKGCKIPGVHLEGPFVSPKEIGAQNPDFALSPDIKVVEELNEIYPVSKVSFAPELPGGVEFTIDLLKMGIVPSAAHSAAKFAEFEQCFAKGLRNLTHFCNQMSFLHHRDIGLVGAGLLHDSVFAELICDNIHICPDMIRLAYKVKGAERIILITDALRCSDMSEGEYTLGGQQIVLSDGVARLKESGAIAGSVLRMNKALKNVVAATQLPLSDVLRSSSFSSSQSLRLGRIGRLECGYTADIALIDSLYNVHMTMVDGEVRYRM